MLFKRPADFFQLPETQVKRTTAEFFFQNAHSKTKPKNPNLKISQTKQKPQNTHNKNTPHPPPISLIPILLQVQGFPNKFLFDFLLFFSIQDALQLRTSFKALHTTSTSCKEMNTKQNTKRNVTVTAWKNNNSFLKVKHCKEYFKYCQDQRKQKQILSRTKSVLQKTQNTLIANLWKKNPHG